MGNSYKPGQPKKIAPPGKDTEYYVWQNYNSHDNFHNNPPWTHCQMLLMQKTVPRKYLYIAYTVQLNFH